MVGRCNGRSDCRDKSDEMNCKTLSRNKENFGTYDKTLVPVSEASPFLDINISVNVKEVIEIGKYFKFFVLYYSYDIS